jgi:hypothetical protein
LGVSQGETPGTGLGLKLQNPSNSEFKNLGKFLPAGTNETLNI